MMEWVTVILTMLSWLVLRFAMPLLITAGVILWLRWLDSRWQKEAEEYAAQNGRKPVPAAQVPCWEVQDCFPERRAACPAYLNSQVPCWQLFRDHDGWLKEDCLGCEVFRGAALPAAA